MRVRGWSKWLRTTPHYGARVQVQRDALAGRVRLRVTRDRRATGRAVRTPDLELELDSIEARALALDLTWAANRIGSPARERACLE